MREFEGKAGIIVGGGGGIGRALALQLAERGAELLIVDRGTALDGTGSDPGVAAQTVAAVAASSGRAHALALDAGEDGAAKAMIEQATALLPQLDFGVYCAGFRHDRALLREDDGEFQRVLSVHLFGAVRFARELAAELVRARREGSVLLATSPAAFAGTTGQSALAIASGGVVGFVRTAATELRRQGVRVNAIVPTARTRLTAELPLFESIRPDSLTPEHVATVAAHLVSDAAASITGEIIGVAGGRIYAYRHAETSGAFLEGPPPSLTAVAAAWRDVTRRS